MTENPAMNPDDYVIDESWHRNELNTLLNDSGTPNADLTDLREKALAEFAGLTHQKTKYLSSAQIEQVITWLKKWKLKDRPLSRNTVSPRIAFSLALDQIRNSPEQVALEKKAYRKTLWARFWTLLFAFSAIFTAGLVLSESHVAWYWVGLGVLVTLALFGIGDMSLAEATKLYKEQEQKNLWEAIRKAETVSELRDAGLFAYLPDSVYEPSRPFSQEKALEVMRAEQERLSDALYRDPDFYLSKSAIGYEQT